jgi:hypothetical protein
MEASGPEGHKSLFASFSSKKRLFPPLDIDPCMFTHRLATEDDLPALRDVMARAIATLQRGFLTEEQITASRLIMGLDTQLITDRTYFMVLETPRSPDAAAGAGERGVL